MAPTARGFAASSDDSVINRRLGRIAWATLVYTVLVILLGAVVRLTGSGSGCGEAWPHCPQVHESQGAERAIELSHRLTSGLSFLLVLALAWAAYRGLARGHVARKSALFAVVFMVVEVVVGAVLVVASLVGSDDSLLRTVVMPAHLVNTMLLTGALAITAACAPGRPRLVWTRNRRTGWLAAALGSMLLTAASGAVTALADTLYPLSGSGIIEHLSGALSPAAHWLYRLRLVHPVIAIASSMVVLAAVAAAADAEKAAPSRGWARAAIALVFAELALGSLNLWLSTPAWVQLTHLGVSQALWIALVMLGVVISTEGPEASAAT